MRLDSSSKKSFCEAFLELNRASDLNSFPSAKPERKSVVPSCPSSIILFFFLSSVLYHLKLEMSLFPIPSSDCDLYELLGFR